MLHLIDRVSKELVTDFGIGFPNQQGVARAVELAVLEHIDGVVLLRAQIDGVAGHMLCHLQGAMDCTACQHEG